MIQRAMVRYSLILMDRESQRVAQDREWLAVYDLSTVGPVVGNAVGPKSSTNWLGRGKSSDRCNE
jgi:hypothetical protein